MNDKTFIFIIVICVMLIILLSYIRIYLNISLGTVLALKVGVTIALKIGVGAALGTIAIIASCNKHKQITGGKHKQIKKKNVLEQRENAISGQSMDNFNVNEYWKNSKPVLIKMFKKLGNSYNHNITETENIYRLYKLQNQNEKWGAYSHRFNRKFIERKFGKSIINILGKLKNVDMYIDYGCGGGKSMDDFIKLLKPIKTYCIDVEDYRKTKYKINSLFTKNNNIEIFDNKFTNNSVDFISAMQSLHHVIFDSGDNATSSFYSRLERIITQFTDKLKLGGYLLLREHDVVSKLDIYPVIFEHLLYELYEENNVNMSVNEVNDWIYNFHNNHQGWYFSAKTLQNLLESKGMKLITLNYKQGKNHSRIYNALYQKTLW